MQGDTVSLWNLDVFYLFYILMGFSIYVLPEDGDSDDRVSPKCSNF
jgi:hypothetical protein